MDTAIDLVLCAIDPRSGRVRFGPELSYALPVAEAADLARAGRVGLSGGCLSVVSREPAGEPLADAALDFLQAGAARPSVEDWVRERSLGRIPQYVAAAVEAGIVTVVPAGAAVFRKLATADPARLARPSRCLAETLDDPAPESAGAAFALLADAAGVAGAHLRGRRNRARRARLASLRREAAAARDTAADPDRILRDGLEAIACLRAARTAAARRAYASGRTVDQQIGLTRDGHTLNAFLNW